MRIRLLNSDGYAGMEEVQFPVEVEAEVTKDGLAFVHETDIARLGCADYFDAPDEPMWPFFPDSWEALE